MSCAAFLSINAAQINLCDLKRSRVLTLATCSLCFRRFVRRRSGEFKRSVPESSPWVLFASFSFGFPGNDKLDLYFFFLRSDFRLWLTDWATQNILRAAAVGHMYTTPTHTHTHTHTHTRAGNTPVDWRQLKVAGRAACKQSREQNGFQVVAEKLEESFGKRGTENSMKELLSWFLCRCLFCRIVVLESRNNSDVLKVWQHERPAPMFTAAVNTWQWS